DEAMGAAAWASNLTVLAVNLNADLRISVPIGVEITVVGHVERIEGRKVYTAASLILPDGRVAATSRGLFLTVDLPGDMTDNPFRPLYAALAEG
ncbi:MAG: hotdog domain-containing protein, partial [Phototrophicaceae bacterium]